MSQCYYTTIKKISVRKVQWQTAIQGMHCLSSKANMKISCLKRTWSHTVTPTYSVVSNGVCNFFFNMYLPEDYLRQIGLLIYKFLRYIQYLYNQSNNIFKHRYLCSSDKKRITLSTFIWKKLKRSQILVYIISYIILLIFAKYFAHTCTSGVLLRTGQLFICRLSFVNIVYWQ